MIDYQYLLLFFVRHLQSFLLFFVFTILYLSNCKQKSVDPSPFAIINSTSAGTNISTSTGTNTSTSPGFYLTNTYGRTNDNPLYLRTTTILGIGGFYLMNGKYYLISTSGIILELNNLNLGVQTIVSAVWEDNHGTGNVEINKYDQNKQLFSGNLNSVFSGKGSFTYSIAGYFYSLPFSKAPDYFLVNDQTQSFGIASVNFEMGALSSTNDSYYGSYIFYNSPLDLSTTLSDTIYINSYNTYSINISIPQKIKPGIYSNDSSGIKIKILPPECSHYGRTLFTYSSGTITISSNNQMNKTLEGAFSGRFKNVYGQSMCNGPNNHSVPGGNFKVHYK